jgi:hypothetical protein
LQFDERERDCREDDMVGAALANSSARQKSPGRWRVQRRAPTVAVLAAALAVIIGAIWDYQTARLARSEMQRVADRSLQLTAKMAASLPADALGLMATRAFRENFEYQQLKALSAHAEYAPASGTVSIKASATMPTLILRFVGIESLSIAATSILVLPGSYQSW